MEGLVDLIVYIYNDYGMLMTILFLILVLSVLGLFWRCYLLKNGSTNRITAEHKSKIIFINGDNNSVRK